MKPETNPFGFFNAKKTHPTFASQVNKLFKIFNMKT